MTKLIISGRLCSGKNEIAKRLSIPELSFAGPLKAFVDRFSPPHATKNEKRRLYQVFGQWGRGRIDEYHPLTPERMAVVAVAKMHGASMTGTGDICWSAFGDTDSFWVDLLYASSLEYNDCAICDCRFANEIGLMTGRGFKHIHMMASIETRMERAGRSYNAVVDENVSEQMAINLDRFFLEGHLLPSDIADKIDNTLVVWNDHRPKPSWLEAVSLDEALSVLLDFQPAESLHL